MEGSGICLLITHVSYSLPGKHSLVIYCVQGFVLVETKNSMMNQTLKQLSRNLSLARKLEHEDTFEHMVESCQCHYERCQRMDRCFYWTTWKGS